MTPNASEPSDGPQRYATPSDEARPDAPSSDEERTDVLIVGAGPAGSAAAIRARELGLSVAVIDKSQFPRDKICGDGLTTNALRYLSALDVSVSDIQSAAEVQHIVLRSPSGREIPLDLPDPAQNYAVVVKRRELDDRLIATAQRRGARLYEQRSISAVHHTDGGVVVETVGPDGAREAFAATWMIAADGMWSPTRKLLGHSVDGYKGDWHGFRQYFDNVSEAASTALFVSFEADLLPGYFWSFPLAGGGANVGFGVQRAGLGIATKVPNVQRMASLWPDLLSRPHIRSFLGDAATAAEPHRAWPIPARIGELPLSIGRTLFVGDAAAACDPMTGEGIGQALQTGYYAATAIAESVRTGSAATPRYTTMIERSLRPDHHMSHLLLRALSHRKGARTAMALVDTNDWTRRNFARWLFEDYPRAALLAPGRWSSVRKRFSGSDATAPWDTRLRGPQS